MAFDQETKAALRILEAIENGSASTADQIALVEDADPTLIYLIFTWLRAHYGANHAASDAVLGRIVDITKRPAVAKMLKEGAEDSVVEWFEDAYSYKDLDAKTFITMIVEKLEG